MGRFWAKVRKSDGCWEWTASTFRRGHGMFRRDRKLQYAHRVAWELTNGPIPDGLWVLHHCDNPPCVRPDHLYLGTHADNTRDAVIRSRMARGEAQGSHKLTEAVVLEIWKVLATGLPTETIGPMFGVCGSTIRLIRRGRRWAHVQHP